MAQVKITTFDKQNEASSVDYLIALKDRQIVKLSPESLNIPSDGNNNNNNSTSQVPVTDNILKKLSIPDVLKGSKSLMTSGDKIELEENHIGKNKSLSFRAEVDTSFGSVTLGHGQSVYNGSYIKITTNTISVYSYGSTETLLNTYMHGLTISGYMTVDITVGNNNRAKIIVQTPTGMYEVSNCYWTGRNGKIFAICNNCTLKNVQLNWMCKDYKKSIWAFGDSYFDEAETSRWTSYLIKNDRDILLLDHYSGRRSDAALFSFKNDLKHGTPQFALWCMGQNDPDTANTINANWMNAVNEFIVLCKANKITPVFGLIPNVKGDSDGQRIHNLKNQWIKDNGYRYIDFPKAVGAYSSTSWYSGMLYSDGVHPTDLGAKALYMQAIVDFPELKYE